MYEVVMTSSDLSHGSWSMSSNIIRKVLMQLLFKILSVLLRCNDTVSQ
jgi:hypothetical protein